MYARKRYRKPKLRKPNPAPRSELSRWGSWVRKSVSAAQMASAALSGVYYLKGMINSEKYKFDTSFSSAVTTSGAIFTVNNIAQGDGDNARTGNSIFVRGLSIQGNATYNASGAFPNGQILRMMVVQDTQQVGDTAPAITDVLESISVHAFLNSETVGRFKVLYNKKYLLDAQRPDQLIKYNKVMRHHIRFNGSASSDVQKGGLYVILITNEATNAPLVSLQIRLNYHDN